MVGVASAGRGPFRNALRLTMSVSKDSAPSLEEDSTLLRIRRTPSTIESSVDVISGVRTSAPSRSLLSTFSPAWVSASSLGRPRNPEVPLIV